MIRHEVQTNFAFKDASEIKSLFATSLQGGMHGLCFSPYLETQNIGDQLSEAQIRQRMEVIKPYTKWVRSFSCTDGNEFIPQVAHEKGLKTMVGAWIGEDRAKNEKEIQALIKLAKQGYVDIAAVGNEVLLRGDLSKEELLQYIALVKVALPNMPVGCVDTYDQFALHPELVEASDVILANCYPFWEGSDIRDSAGYLQKMQAITKEAAKGKEIMITETGWPSRGSNTGEAEPSALNAMKYFIEANEWSQKYGISMFYFSSFDESWKIQQEGNVGPRWGIWDKNDKLKYKEDVIKS